ncbi:MAG: hypothetical protein GY745_20395 [Actinomycetia bacterium]|nr:hypothetical protein [Actinomycetes bacterium]
MILILSEVWALVRGRLMFTFLSFITAAVCAASIVVGVGGAEATRSEILASLDAPSQRLIVVTDDGGSAGISEDSTKNLLRASTVEWAVAASELADTALASAPLTRIPTRWIDVLPKPVRVVAGRAPAHGEATIPIELARSSGLNGPWGSVVARSGTTHPIVGLTETNETLGPIDNTAFIVAGRATFRISRVIVQVSGSAAVESTRTYTRDAIAPVDDSAVAIVSTDSDAQVQLGVADGLARNRRRAGVASLIAASVLNAANGFALVSSQRRRFGLTRALGATRSRIAVLILGFSLLTAGTGGLAGTALAALAQAWRTSLLPTGGFLMAGALAVSLSSMVGTLGPAIVAGREDPVAVLRSP